MSYPLEVVTHHEAGHVVGCLVQRLSMESAHVERGFWGGITGGHVRLVNEDRMALGPNIVMTLAGGVAERHWCQLNGLPFDPAHNGSDLEIAHELLARYRRWTEAQAWAHAETLVSTHWARITAVAAHLGAKKRLSQGQAKRVRAAS
jgi:hypothetical protein